MRRREKDTVIVPSIEWHTAEFGSENAAQVHADMIESSGVSLVAGPHVTGPYTGPNGLVWLVEWTSGPR